MRSVSCQLVEAVSRGFAAALEISISEESPLFVRN
jgi:hypothetical protein